MINEWWLWEEEEVRPRPVKIEEAQQLGKVWKDPYLGMEFVWVPGGCYEMGCGSWTSNCDDDEKPVHTVCVNGFWMGKYEVTVGEYMKCVDAGECKPPEWLEWLEKGSKYYKELGSALTFKTYPIVGVSWHDAQAFAKWLSKKTGYKFRLPTEAEWEYACRSGGKKIKYGTSTGDYLSHNLANYNRGALRWIYTTSPVGSFPPNELDIYDMSGNVWEWCEDVYSSDAYKHHNRNNPMYTGGGSNRVVRGGGWGSEPRYLRCANRYSSLPSRRDDYVGFRLLLQK